MAGHRRDAEDGDLCFGGAPAGEGGAHGVRTITPEAQTRFSRLSGGGTRVHDGVALRRLIEGEVVPRLLMIGRDAAPLDVVKSFSPQAVAEYADLTYRASADPAMAFVEARRAEGASAETLVMALLAPAARKLGADWEADRVGLFDVTVGLGRIEEAHRRLAPQFARKDAARACDIRVLLAPAPGDQHGFGLMVVESFLARAGFSVTRINGAAAGRIVDLVASEPFDVVGFSLGASRHIGALSELIRQVRADSIRESPYVVVGGHAFQMQQNAVKSIGADGFAVDGETAVALLRRALRLDERRRVELMQSGEAKGVERRLFQR